MYGNVIIIAESNQAEAMILHEEIQVFKYIHSILLKIC